MTNHIENPEQGNENLQEQGETAAVTPAGRARSRRRRPRARKAKQGQPVQKTADAAAKAEDPIRAPEEKMTGGSAAETGPGEQAGRGKSRRRRRRPRKGLRPETAPTEAGDANAGKKPKDTTRRILINARYADEKRVAIIEGDSLSDFYIETASREQLKGNIYKGIVSSVMPGLQAAFIDFGQKKHGFLQFHDIMPELYAAAKEGGREGKRNVQDSLVKGQDILVQVTKDEHGTKGASLTTYISIPGRYIVMMPGQKRVGISRKIENREDRDRLKETFSALKLPKDMGFILRTACSDSIEEELSRDLKYLTKLWVRIQTDAAKAKAPALIYKEQDIAMRTVRDYLTADVVEILIDDPKTCAATKAFLKKIMPWRKINVIQYREKEPLFSLYNVEVHIARLSQRSVMLPSKGYLIFDKTEALTSVDVNSGRSRKEDNAESTALTTNLEAVDEVARQLRLRDIGGLIAIDFIDMESGRNRKLLEISMMEALSMDKASTDVAGLSKFSILEMTRERLRPAYGETISRKCPLCDGKGSVGSDEFIALSALRELHSLAAAGKDNISGITCRLSVESANLLLNSKRRELSDLENEYGIAITVTADPSVPAGQYSMDVLKKKQGGEKVQSAPK
jgi:ribonuclease E